MLCLRGSVEIRASSHLFYKYFHIIFLSFPFISNYWLHSHAILFAFIPLLWSHILTQSWDFILFSSSPALTATSLMSLLALGNRTAQWLFAKESKNLASSFRCSLSFSIKGWGLHEKHLKLVFKHCCLVFCFHEGDMHVAQPPLGSGNGIARFYEHWV